MARFRLGLAAAVVVLGLSLSACTNGNGGITTVTVTSLSDDATLITAPTTSAPVGTSSDTPEQTAPVLSTTIPADQPSKTSRTATSRRTTVTSTVTSTLSGKTITVGPPTPTSEPAAVAGDCPYLSADAVSDITGQHHGPTQLIMVAPHPICMFSRSDGGFMASVRLIAAASPQAAIAAVNQHVPVAGSQPATQPTGWSGGSMITGGQMTQDSTASSTYAVSKGKNAIVAEENESPSIKARLIATCAIYGLGLQSGALPDFCTGPTG